MVEKVKQSKHYVFRRYLRLGSRARAAEEVRIDSSRRRQEDRIERLWTPRTVRHKEQLAYVW